MGIVDLRPSVTVARRIATALVLFVLLAVAAPIGGADAAPPTTQPASDAPDRCQTAMFERAAPKVTVGCERTTTLETLATTLPSGFQESVQWSGLTNPTAVRFASDGRVFVTEKSGIIKVFDSLADLTPTTFNVLTPSVQDFWDRGLLGLALDPSLTDPTLPSRPWIYVLYTYDHILGDSSPAPRWGDTCPSPPAATTDGCVVSGRLSRFSVSGSTISGPEQVLIEDWCQQFPSHSIGSLTFGPDGALYVSGGDGANFGVVDYGQLGGTLANTPTPINPCNDAPGGAVTPPAAAGGALRSQDVRTDGAPVVSGYPAIVQADAPGAYWRLGETAGTVADNVIGTLDGSYVGSPTLGSTGAPIGGTNTAVRLNGSSQYVAVPDAAAIDLGNAAQSYELWFRRTGNFGASYSYLLSKGTQVGLTFDAANKLMLDNDGSETAVTTRAFAADDGWHHLVAVHDPGATKQNKLYIDGVEQAVKVNDNIFSANSTALHIGRYVGGSDHFAGFIDEVAIYPIALSAAQVTNHFTATAPAGTADPATLDGAILRVDPVTGAAFAGNPYASNPDLNKRRVIAFGLRNPFRITARPGTNELWVGDVGWNTWEEVNRIANVSDATVENFGWPCYEGVGRQPGYDGANLTLCEDLYAAGTGAIAAPVYTYNHSATVITGETCTTGSSAIAGMAFYPEAGGSFPVAYRGGLFFADHNRSCIWFMPKGTDGQPDPTQRQAFAPGAANPVDVQIGPNGDLYYVDFDGGTIRRIAPLGVNQAPTARIVAVPESGPAPLTVAFDGRTSTDPEAGALTYRWDLDGDLAYDDSTSATPSFTYTSGGTVTVRLEVTDVGLATGTTTKVITIGTPNRPPVPTIEEPIVGTTWGVGDPLPIHFSGSATDPEDGAIDATTLDWGLVLQHCPSNCHPHGIETFTDKASGDFFPPDHDYPSYLELTLTATDSSGLSASVTRRLDPRTVSLSFATSPSGLSLTVGDVPSVAPFSRTVIDGSANTITALPTQTVGGVTYTFAGWSDGGAATHTIIGRSGGSYVATYTAPPPPVTTDISVTKTGSRSGNTVTFPITVRHVSGATAQTVVMRDTLPQRLDYVSATTTRGSCSISGSTLTCSIGALAAGQTAVITLVTNASKLNGSVTNTATVTTTTAQTQTTNDSSTVSVRLR